LDGYRVNLEIFAGPLDLLLHLVKKDEVDIYEISISKITDQYLHYIKVLKELDIDIAGDFLVMAATLMQIKSAMLLPRTESDSEQDDQDLTDPRTQLIHQLLEYKKFKDAANRLGDAVENQQTKYPRPSTVVRQLKGNAVKAQQKDLDIEQVSVWDLLDAFDSVMQATGGHYDISRIQDDTPIDLYEIEMLTRLQDEGAMTFKTLFTTGSAKIVLVGMFLALLELIRDDLISVEQSDKNEEIYIKALTDIPAEKAVQNAVLKAQKEYENSEYSSQLNEQQSNTTENSENTDSKPKIPIVELPPDKISSKLQQKNYDKNRVENE
jgi:segregation and condensation protein A